LIIGNDMSEIVGTFPVNLGELAESVVGEVKILRDYATTCLFEVGELMVVVVAIVVGTIVASNYTPKTFA
jgi:hypothetical protein